MPLKDIKYRNTQENKLPNDSSKRCYKLKPKQICIIIS